MTGAIVLTAVMATAVAAVPVTLWYLVKVKELHKPEDERKSSND